MVWSVSRNRGKVSSDASSMGVCEVPSPSTILAILFFSPAIRELAFSRGRIFGRKTGRSLFLKMLLDNFFHGFGRTAEARALAAHHNRPLDQDRMLRHGGDEHRVGELGVIEAERVEGRAAPAQKTA